MISNHEKYELNKKYFEENIRLSKNIKIFPEYQNIIFKQIGRQKVPFMNIFKGDNNVFYSV